MILTVQDIIEAQFRLIGVLDPTETLEPSLLTHAMQTNNIMLDSWSAQRLMIRSMTQESFPLTAGQASYTIGIGGNFNTTKPLEITDAFIRDPDNMDTNVNLYTEDQFKSREDKGFDQGRPEALWYDPGLTQQTVPTGTIWLYNTPDSSVAYTLFLTSQKALTEFVNPTDVLHIEPQYYRAIKYQGAIEQYYEYRKHTQSIPSTIRGAAAKSMAIIKNLNATQIIVPMELPGCKRGAYNIMTGEDFA